MKAYILYIDEPLSLQYAEDCLDSCTKFNVDSTLFQGIKGKTNRELTRKYGYHIKTFDYSSEYCGTVGHFEIWKEIVKSGEVGIVLEHDAVVMGDLNNLTVEDGEILFLGPRLYDREHYTFPIDETINYIDIDFYNGAHAYAITANTAAMMLDQLEQSKLIQMPIDGLLGLKNKFNMKLKAVDPVFAIAEVGIARRSFNFDKPDPTNRYYFDKFLKCIDSDKLPPVQERKFTVDWFSEHIPHWEETLKLADKDVTKRLNVLEIGAYEGKSTCWFSDNVLLHLDSNIDVVDTFQGSVEHEKIDTEKLQQAYVNNISLTRNTEKIHTYVGDSRHYLPLFLKEGKKYDIIYIDGAHMTENVIIDGLCAYHLLKDDGVIVFDDYGWSHEGIKTVKAGLDKLETMVNIKPILTGWQRSYTRG
jgi:predicted O-methyltransferase YrrM/GR25 family glycosyltransferase involved in LPS biosynthesis